ncbi:MAG: hypothetical protein PWQ12_1271 [Clostridiales bacterium]|jgi:two-component system LytT family response regulator|nr:hypothetical protein [Clostridiales bacterium]
MEKLETKNILIVEDDSNQRKNLEQMIISVNAHYQVFSASNYQEALRIAFSEKIDLFFFDIDLKDSKTGYELAETLRNNSRYRLTWMIFLTVRTDMELRAYKEIHCFSYVIKPYSKADIKESLDRLLEDEYLVLKKAEMEYITLELEHMSVRVNLDEIIYIEAKGRSSSVVTVRGTYNAPYVNLKWIEQNLKQYSNFLKVHRSFIANVNYIKAIKKYSYRQQYLEFYKCEDEIPISNTHKKWIGEILNQSGAVSEQDENITEQV